MTIHHHPCSACGAPLAFVPYHKPPHNLGAIEEVPVPKGNILIEGEHYRILVGADLTAARKAGQLLHISHFANCPAKAAFRRKP